MYQTNFSCAQTENWSVMLEVWAQQRTVTHTTDEVGVYIEKMQKTFGWIRGQRMVEIITAKLNYVTFLCAN